MTLNTFIFQSIKSGYMWPSQTLDRFYTDNQSLSVQAPYKDFNTSHVIRSPFKCQSAYTHLFSVYKELFPTPVCASACIILRKSAFICTDSESGCGRQIFSPYIAYVGKRIWSVKISEDKMIHEIDFRLQLITWRTISSEMCLCCVYYCIRVFSSVASVGFTCCTEPYSPQATYLLPSSLRLFPPFLHIERKMWHSQAYTYCLHLAPFMCQLTLSRF